MHLTLTIHCTNPKLVQTLTQSLFALGDWQNTTRVCVYPELGIKLVDFPNLWYDVDTLISGIEVGDFGICTNEQMD